MRDFLFYKQISEYRVQKEAKTLKESDGSAPPKQENIQILAADKGEDTDGKFIKITVKNIATKRNKAFLICGHEGCKRTFDKI